MEAKKLAVLVIVAVLVVGLLLLGLSDTVISVADTDFSDNEVAGSVSDGNSSNSSASAVIMITVFTVADE